jgi:serine/threonine protein kinase
MSDVWKNLEGQIVGQVYELKEFLALTGHSAVYLTQYGPDARKAAIKFISTDFPEPEKQLDRWLLATSLRHPNLLQVLDSGRTRLAQMDLLYVVIEFADEDLAQVLPQRSLSLEEAQDIFPSLLAALRYLHANSVIHGHISPTNIMAAGDQLKISSDAIVPIGQSRMAYRELDGYDAPESANTSAAAAVDVWSLGATLVEILTQQPPALFSAGQADPKVPDTLPQPFLDIARRAYVCDPDGRSTIPEISARLNPMAAVAAASTTAAALGTSPAVSPAPAPPAPSSSASLSSGSVSPSLAVPGVAPLSVPLSSEPPIPSVKLQTPRVDLTPRSQAQRPPQGVVLPNYVVPLLAGVLILVAMYALPKILRHRDVSSNTEVSAAPPVAPVARNSDAPQVSSKPKAAAERPAEQPEPQSAPEKSQVTSQVTSQVNPEKLQPSEPTSATAPSSAPAVLRSDDRSPSLETKSAHEGSGKGDVLDQVMPQVSAKALSTIHGTVRIAVRAHVDAAGSVTNAELDSPSSSKYFAGLAENAARKWVFSAPEADQHSIPSEWLIHFEFTQSGVKASASQVIP